MTRASHRPRFRQAIPNQHGAWAFLLVPLMLGFSLSGFTAVGGLFAFAWVAGYPVWFFTLRAARVGVRRHRMTPRARRDVWAAAYWAAALAPVAAILLIQRPWLAIVGVLAVGLWGISLWLSLHGRERGITNDLLLVAQASSAVPLLYLVTVDSLTWNAAQTDVWVLTWLCTVYFTGTVIHVKSLIREVRNPRWHRANLIYHSLCLAVAPFINPWFTVPFAAGLLRSLLLRPGTRPAVVGAIEIVVSALVLAAGILAVS